MQNNERTYGMDFFKKVISSVGITGLAPGFPYALDSLIAKETEVGVTSGIWSMHSGHKISLKKVFQTIKGLISSK